MKVLLVNGSGHAKGCTYTALEEVAGALEKNGIETARAPCSRASPVPASSAADAVGLPQPLTS